MNIKSIINNLLQPKGNQHKKGMSLGDFYNLFTGRGVALHTNHDAYRKSLYVYACVSKIAEKVASIDVNLYQITNSKGDTKEVNSHPALDLIYKPNQRNTKAEFIESLVINMLLGGECFAYKIRAENNNKVVGLKALRPDYVTIVSDTKGDIMRYEFSKDGVTKVLIEPTDMVHIKFYNPFDESRGFSPITPAKNRIETEEYATGYQKDFFERDAQPKAIIKMQDSNVPEEEKSRIREDFETRFKGSNRESNVAILEGGMEYERVSLGQKEMDYIESLKFTRDDILVAFKVPKPIVAITDDVNLANAKTAMVIFTSETVVPMMRRIVEKFNEEMVYTDFDPRLFFSFDDPTPENKDAKLKEYEVGLTQGYLLPNEVRQLEGLPPMAGGWTLYKPAGMVPVGGISQGANKSIEDTNLAKHYEGLRAAANGRNTRNIHGKAFVKDLYVYIDSIKVTAHKKTMANIKAKGVVVENMQDVNATTQDKAAGQALGTYSELSRIKNKADRAEYEKAINTIIDNRAVAYKNAVTKYFEGLAGRVLTRLGATKGLELKAIDPKKLINMAKEEALFAELSFPFIEDFVKNAGQDTLNSLAPAEAFNLNEVLASQIKARVAFLAKSVTETTATRIINIVSEGLDAGMGRNEIAGILEDVITGMSLSRADLIARTEATYANNLGLSESYKQSGVATHKEWIATNDARTREEHLHLDGEVVPLDSNFSNGLPYPQEPNCRCVIAPAFKE